MRSLTDEPSLLVDEDLPVGSPMALIKFSS